MMYKLINRQTGEQYFCDKVTIDGFDYYVSDDLKVGDKVRLKSDINVGQVIDDINKDWRILWFKPIATNNPNIDIPQVVDEVEMLANIEYPFAFGGIGNIENTLKNHFIKGYNKSQETHPFSKEDMIDFALYVANVPHTPYKPVKELFQLWKEQRIKTLYYE